MDVFIDRDDPRPLGLQLYEQLRDAIVDGRLRAGDQLQPSRDLAGQLGLSRFTVTTAYGRLAAEGYTLGRTGGGSIVAAIDGTAMAAGIEGGTPPRRRRTVTPAKPATLRLARSVAGLQHDRTTHDRTTHDRAALDRTTLDRTTLDRTALDQAALDRTIETAPTARFDLRAGRPDPALFPADAWRRALADAARSHVRSFGDPQGEQELRVAVSRWVGRSRAVVADPDRIVMTSGTQHALDLLARVLLDPGDVAAVEDPGYAPAATLLRAVGASVVGVRADDQGIVVDELPADARLVVVTPSHQYPLGTTMSLQRRRALLAWADRHDAVILEDDYDTELRHVDRPLEPIQRLDDHGRVVYLGTFSKTLSPSLRTGFAVLPSSLVGPVAALRAITDVNPPVVAQLALATFVDGGHLDRHLRRTRRIYAERYRLLHDALHGPLRAFLAPLPSTAGLHITALLGDGLDEHAVRGALWARGLAVSGLASCAVSGSPRARPGGLVLGYGAVTADALPKAIALLGSVLASTHR